MLRAKGRTLWPTSLLDCLFQEEIDRGELGELETDGSDVETRSIGSSASGSSAGSATVRQGKKSDYASNKERKSLRKSPVIRAAAAARVTATTEAEAATTTHSTTSASKIKCQPATHSSTFRLALALITSCVYLRALTCGFVYDDQRAILENADVSGAHEPDSWTRLWFNDFWGVPMAHRGSHKSYRPIVILSFKLQNWLHRRLASGQSAEQLAFVYHLANVLLHMCVVDQIYTMLSSYACRRRPDDSCLLGLAQRRKQQRRRHNQEPRAHQTVRCTDGRHLAMALNSCQSGGAAEVASLTALLFACHPVHVEAVTSLVGRAELMGALFALKSFEHLALHLGANLRPTTVRDEMCRPDERRNWTDKRLGGDMARALVYALLASLCKENCAMIVVINLLLISWWTVKSASLHVRQNDGREAALGRGGGGGRPRGRRRGDFDLGAFVLMCAIAAFYAYLRLMADPSATMPQFSPLDNPLALKSQQFCLNYPEEVVQEFAFASTQNRGRLVRQPDNLNELCANKRVLGRIESWRTLTKLYLPLKSLQLLVSPILLSYDWPLESIGLVRDVHDYRLLLALLGYVTIFAVILRWMKSLRPFAPSTLGFKIRMLEGGEQGRGKKQDLLAEQLGWSLVWLVLPYLPASNLLFPVGFLLAERTLYLPSFGFCLLAGHALSGLEWGGRPGKRRGVFSGQVKVGLGALLLVLGAARIHERNADWHSNLTLFSSNVHQSPAKSVANLATLTAAGNGSHELAERLYRRALEWQPRSPDLHYNLALVLQRAEANQRPTGGRQSKADGSPPADEVEYHYKLALELRKNFALAALNLGAHKYAGGQLKEAERSFERCALMEPRGVRNLRHHIGAQIECLISRAKLELGRQGADWELGEPNGGGGTQGGPSGREQTSRASRCAQVLEWMRMAQRKIKQIARMSVTEVAPHKSAPSPSKSDNGTLELTPATNPFQPADLARQQANVDWLTADCQLEGSQRLRYLRRAADLARASAAQLGADVYLAETEALLASGARRAAAELLAESLAVERAKGAGRNEGGRERELGRLHGRLARLLERPGERRSHAEAALSADAANTDYLTLAAQLAYDEREYARADRLTAKLVELLEGERLARLERPGANLRASQPDLLHRKLASAHANRGAVMQVSKRPRLAERHYRRALDYDPANSVASANLKRLAREQ